jgi:hypothetical protein
MERSRNKIAATYIRVQGGVTIKLMQGLNVNLSYQTELDNYYSKTIHDADRYSVRQMVNDATQISGSNIVRNLPEGGQLYENRYNTRNWTIRGQVNFDRVFDKKHAVTAITGTEWRSENYYSTTLHRMGFDDKTLVYPNLNMVALANLSGTQSMTGRFNYSETDNNKFQEIVHRYISFYGNAAYTFDGKYALTLSLRMDDTDPLSTYLSYGYGKSFH